tara:strand:+ start:12690 stop:12809 length:120 start_codon:yes stop_codon:yes gene_type:complete
MPEIDNAGAFCAGIEERMEEEETSTRPMPKARLSFQRLD